MAEAIKASDLKAADPELTKRQNQRQRGKGFAGKKFEDLTKAQKDKLLKAVAIQLGLIDDSEDGE